MHFNDDDLREVEVSETSRRRRGSDRVLVDREEGDYRRVQMESSERALVRASQSHQSGQSSRRSGDVRGSRHAAPPQTPLARLVAMLPDNVWVNRIIMLVLVIILIVALIGVGSAAAQLVSNLSARNAAKSEPVVVQQETPAEDGQADDGQGADGDETEQAPAATGVVSPWTKTGGFTTGDAVLDGYIKTVCDEHTKDGLSAEDNAYNTYLYVSRLDYVERDNNQEPEGADWDVQYAKQFFEEDSSGNCYNFTAVTEYVLKYFGYEDADAEPCVVELQSGDWGDHGLVFVTDLDGSHCIVDDALSANGWMLPSDSYTYDIKDVGQTTEHVGNANVLSARIGGQSVSTDGWL